jgi:hypothetical protein
MTTTMTHVPVKTFAQLPSDIQALIIDYLKMEHASGQLGTEAAVKSKAQDLAEKHGYAWKPSREWVQWLKQARLGIVKRRYRYVTACSTTWDS